MRQQRGNGVRHKSQAVAHEVGDRGAGSLVWYVQQLDAGHRRELLDEQVLGGAVTGRAERHLAGLLLGLPDEVLHRFDLGCRVDDEHLRDRGHAGHRLEVLQRPVFDDRRLQRRGDRHRAAPAHEQRIAVGRLRRHVVGADGAAGAGTIVDHHGLAERRVQALAQQPHERVGPLARRKRHDELDRMGRIHLRVRRGRRDGNERGQQALLPGGHALSRVGAGTVGRHGSADAKIIATLRIIFQ